MNGWRTTGALSRAAALAGLGLGLAVVFGDPVLVVLTAPFLPLVAMALLHRPRTVPRVDARLDHYSLHEGQGTRSRLLVDGARRGRARRPDRLGGPYVAMHPADGRLGALVAGPGDVPVLEISPRRWGRRILGGEDVALTSRWAGFRWGPRPWCGKPDDQVLPGAGAVRLPGGGARTRWAWSVRTARAVWASGTEFAGIRPFHAGDRLRRVNWRVSLRTGDLHVVTARAEEDTGVLLVVDALADHGRSGGVDGEASSLDVTVRAAAALAEHHVRRGDRVGLRVVGPRQEVLGYGAGRGHLRMLLGRLALVQPGELRGPVRRAAVRGHRRDRGVRALADAGRRGRARPRRRWPRRGLPVMVVDTLPDDVAPAVVEGTDPAVAGLAWRMRRLQRDQVLARLAGARAARWLPWRGPGTARRRAAPPGPACPAAADAGPVIAALEAGAVAAAGGGGRRGRGGPARPGARRALWPATGVLVLLVGGARRGARAVLPAPLVGTVAHGPACWCWWGIAFRDGLHPRRWWRRPGCWPAHLAGVVAASVRTGWPWTPRRCGCGCVRGCLVFLLAPVAWLVADGAVSGRPEPRGSGSPASVLAATRSAAGRGEARAGP